MSSTTILRYERRNPSFSFVDANGTAIDMTVSGRALVLKLTSASGTVALSISPTWTSQSGGTGTFVFSTAQTASLTAGTVYYLEVFYTASADSEARRVYGPEKWTVETAKAGSF